MLCAAKHATISKAASGAAMLSLVLFAALALSVRSARNAPAGMGTKTLDIVHMLEDNLNGGFDDMPFQPTSLLPQDNHRTALPHSTKYPAADHTTGAYGMFKYYVPAPKAAAFVGNWSSMEVGSRAEAGTVFVSLHKTLDDNLLHIGYGEWEDEAAFRAHMQQEYVKRFFDYMLGEGIAMEWEVLLRLTEDVHRGADAQPGGRKGAAGGDASEPASDGHYDRQLRFMTRYMVPPSHFKAFLKAWQVAADQVQANEPGASIYALRKAAGNNLEWYEYGAWATWEDYLAHVHSDGSQQLRQWTADHAVVWQQSPLRLLDA